MSKHQGEALLLPSFVSVKLPSMSGVFDKDTHVIANFGQENGLSVKKYHYHRLVCSHFQFTAYVLQ